MGVQEAGVYWPFKNLLQGSGIIISETATAVTIGTTGAGPGGGDMLKSEYATNGQTGVVDKALSAATVTGIVAHATLADSVPWGGIVGAPTIFPSDWGSITNKPTAFPPAMHGATHISTGGDAVPVASATASGLMIALSGRPTDFVAGDGTWKDLNTTVGSYALTMQAALTCSAGVTVQGSNVQINNGTLQINNPAGTWSGIYNVGANNAVFAFSNGTDLTHEACALYKASGSQALAMNYWTAAGAQLYAAEIVTTYNPSGLYAFRAGTRLVNTNDLPGDNTAWSKAPVLCQANNAGGFGGIGLHSPGYWACALGAWQTGVWIATSSNTFVQLTDNSGHIVAGALGSGVAATNLGYWPVSRGGDTMTGDLWVNKGSAQVMAWQDGNNWVRMLAGSAGRQLAVVGNGYINDGQIFIQDVSNGWAGISFYTNNGYQYTLYGDNGGRVIIRRINDQVSKVIFP